jgi:cytoskeleton protein RodZ
VSSGIGEILRDAREEQGRTLDEASAATSIRRHQLAALEDERYDSLGGSIYARGFIRSYASWLGLDPEPLVERYRREMERDDTDLHALADELEPEQRRRPWLPGWVAWAAVGALLLFAAFSVIGTLDGRSPQPVAQSGVEETEPPDDGDETDGGAEEETPEEEREEEVEEPAGVTLSLIVEERAWMQVEVDGSVVEERAVPAGETLEFEAEEEVGLVLGNAGGVTVVLNDERQGSLAGRGQVWRGTCSTDGCSEGG